MADKMPGRGAQTASSIPVAVCHAPRTAGKAVGRSRQNAECRMKNEECRMPDPGKDLVGRATQAADAVKGIIAADDRLAVVAAE
jgi:hypothetical protein